MSQSESIKGQRFFFWNCLNLILVVICVFSLCLPAFSQESNNNSVLEKKNVVPEVNTDQGFASKTPIDLKNSKNEQHKNASLSNKRSYYRSLISTIGSLALVIGFFLGIIYLLKTLAPNKFVRNSALIEVVDSCRLSRKAELLTIKWGSKLILVSSFPDNAVLLSEIADVEEKERMIRELQDNKLKHKGSLPALKSFPSFVRKRPRE
jgi:flagellar biogenesis protein FliO